MTLERSRHTITCARRTTRRRRTGRGPESARQALYGVFRAVGRASATSTTSSTGTAR